MIIVAEITKALYQLRESEIINHFLHNLYIIATLLNISTTENNTLGNLACMIFSKSEIEILNTVLIMRGNLIQWKQFQNWKSGKTKKGQSKVGFGIVWNLHLEWNQNQHPTKRQRNQRNQNQFLSSHFKLTTDSPTKQILTQTCLREFKRVIYIFGSTVSEKYMIKYFFSET